MNKTLAGIAILFLTLTGLTSCKLVIGLPNWRGTSDRAVSSNPTGNNNNTATVPKNAPLAEALAPLWKQELSYTTFSGRAKMHYDGPGQKQEFTANFRVRKDSVIWVAITALGGIVQVARICITPDSFKMLNIINKEATLMPLSQAAKILPTAVDFATLQNLVVGEALRKTGSITGASEQGATWNLEVNDDHYIQQLAYNKVDSTLHTYSLHTKDPDGPQGTMEYTDYQIISNRKVSSSRTINIQNAGQQYYLDMNFIKIDFDEQQEYPFSVPKSYSVKEVEK